MSTETSLKSDTNASGLAENTVQVEMADEVRDLPLLPSSPARLDSTARRTSVLFAGERHHRGSVTATITNRLACEEALLDQRLKQTLEEEDDEQDNTDQQQQHYSMEQDTSVSDSATAADDTSTNTSLDRKRNRNSSMFMSETNMDLEDLAAELAQAEQEYLQLSTTTSSNGDHQPDTETSPNSNATPSNDPLEEAMRMHEEVEKEFLEEQQLENSPTIKTAHKPDEAPNPAAVSNTDSPQKTQSTSSSIGDRKFIISDESNTTSSKPRRQTESGSSSLKKEADDESSSRPPTSRRLQPPLPERRWIVLSSGAMAGVVAGFLVKESRKNLVSSSQHALGLSVVLVASASLTYYASQRER